MNEEEGFAFKIWFPETEKCEEVRTFFSVPCFLSESRASFSFWSWLSKTWSRLMKTSAKVDVDPGTCELLMSEAETLNSSKFVDPWVEIEKMRQDPSLKLFAVEEDWLTRRRTRLWILFEINFTRIGLIVDDWILGSSWEEEIKRFGTNWTNFKIEDSNFVIVFIFV